jgi:hypothetical protein
MLFPGAGMAGNQVFASMLLNETGIRRRIKRSEPMANVDSNQNSGLTLVGYCARVALALAVVVIAFKITLDHWPCQLARIAVCPS